MDSRRFYLNQVQGTLTNLVNAHISSGSEMEKRKKFLPYLLPAATFGEQETTAGITVFGSRDVSGWIGTETVATGTSVIITIAASSNFAAAVGDPITVAGSGNPFVNGNWVISAVTLSLGVVVAISFTVTNASTYIVAEPTTIVPYFAPPIIYQQLVHPLGKTVTMTGIVSSTYFGGVVQSISTWSNGDTLVYDGASVDLDWYVGSQCNITPTPYAIAQSLIAQATATGKYTGMLAPLVTLQFQVTGGTNSAGVNQIQFVGYNFNRSVSLNNGSGQSTSTEFFILFPAVDWATSNNATAAAVAASINANSGGANPYGFIAANPSANIVTIAPPATDFFGNPLGINGADTLTVTPAGNVTIFIPPHAESFDILSVPDNVSANPYTVATTVVDAALPFKLVSNGIPSALPVGAAGLFAITQGNQNVQGTGTLTASGTPVANDTVTIGTGSSQVVYTFVPALGAPANQVLLGVNGTASLQNLVSAVNGSSGAGAIYSSGTSVNTQISFGAVSGAASLATAINGGTPGNIPVSTTSAGLTWSGLTAGHLTGGTDVNQVSQISVGAMNLLSAEVPFNQSVNQTAADVVTAINGFQGTSGFSATANGAAVTILAINGGTSVNFALVTVVCAGDVCIANCSFFVNGVAGETLTAITVIATNIMTTTLTYRDGGHPTETLAAFCIRVVANINANSGTGLKYLAASVNNQIWISPVTTTSNDAIPLVVTSGTLVITAGQSAALTVSNNVNAIGMIKVNGKYVTQNYPSSAVVTAQGGVPPYTYNWTFVSGPGAAGRLAAQLVGMPNQWWIESVNSLGAVTDGWICTVTDSNSPASVIASSPFYITVPSNAIR